jgi:spore coat polysaccharide biosynthesis predicted glycosyltransferase SpsG
MINIIYEKSSIIGNGHYMRCKSIYETIQQEYKFPVQLVNETDFNYNNEENGIYFLDFFSIEKSTALINSVAKKNAAVTLDYFSNNAIPDANISVFEQFNEKRLYPSFVGLEYCIIRKEFAEHVPVESKPQEVFVYVGGNGNKAIVEKIASMLGNMPYTVKLVRNENSEATDKLPENFKTYYLPSNLIDLMNNSCFAITSPGVITAELMYLEVPSILCPLNGLQEKFADYFVQNGWAIGKLADADFADVNRIEKVRQTIKGKVDTNGINRIIQIALDCYEKKMGCSYS